MVDIRNIALERISFGYAQDALLFSNLSHSFKAKKKHAIVGMSGVGKTSLMKLIMGIERPLSGKIVFDGVEASAKPRIGYVSQSYSLFPWLSVYDNIALGAHQINLNKDALDERIRRLGLQFGIEGALKLYPNQLSGGMKQRTAVARAICGKPDVLCFDEPFSALDVASKKQARDIINNVALESSRTTFFVTHDIREAVELTDFIHIMKVESDFVEIECIKVCNRDPEKVERFVVEALLSKGSTIDIVEQV